MPIYMEYKVNGSKLVQGDVTADGYVNWIEISSFQWGVGRGIGSPHGSSTNREASAPSVSEITMTKLQDNGTPQLLEEAFNGTGSSVKIVFLRTGQPPVVYLDFTLTNVLLSGYSTSSGGDRPSESLSLNFTKIQVNVTPMKGDATAGAAIPVVYDLALMKLNP